jgi:transcription termination factor NusB
MSSLEKLKLKIISLKENQQNILSAIEKVKIKSRYSIIQKDYHSKLHKIAPWLKVNAGTKNSGDNEDDTKNGQKENFCNSILRKIKNNPSEKETYITDYLENFAELSETDKKVLSDNFQALSIEELETEFTNLYELFGK